MFSLTVDFFVKLALKRQTNFNFSNKSFCNVPSEQLTKKMLIIFLALILLTTIFKCACEKIKYVLFQI